MAVCGQAAPGRGSRRVQEVHHYADLFWNRKKYPRELEQYQKLAVLTALKAVESPRWTKYAQLVGQEDEEAETCSRWMQCLMGGTLMAETFPKS